MKEKIEIPLNKSKIIGLTIGSLLFVVVGIWLFSNASNFQNTSLHFLREPFAVKLIGILAIILFGLTGIYAFRKIFDKKAGLVIDSEGITDNSNALSIGLIEWNDITGIYTQQVMSTKFLLINVIDSEKYINKSKNRINAKLMRSNMKTYGTPLAITSNTLKYNFEKLQQLVQTEFKRNKDIN